MLSTEQIQHFEKLLSKKIVKVHRLTGGDINEVYLICSHKHRFVVKLNDSIKFPFMFEYEARGLQELKKTKTFTIPQVLYTGTIKDTAFLILEYIDSVSPSDTFWESFGQKLALLHQCTSSYFGFEENNYIGCLPQYNLKNESVLVFYISQRLEPQFKLAVQNGFSFPDLKLFYKAISNEIPNEPPSLIHGDLWSGNYMIDSIGMPCLIDPALAYVPREMDIAMMHLFGGFDAKLFEIYNEIFPLKVNWKKRMPIFQLYYLLVHLNLFGKSYYHRVKNIVSSYS